MRDGVVLVITIVLLVVLSMLAYTLTTRVSRQVHRDDYMVDYTKARYACDSAVRYALATLEDLEPELISRPNEPDFSDLFGLDDEQVDQMMAEWGLLIPEELDGMSETDMIAGMFGLGDGNDANSLMDGGMGMDMGDEYLIDPNDPNGFGPVEAADESSIRGPYGPEWPLIMEAKEFAVGDVNVSIEIEDENAKYPIGWALLGGEEISRESEASFEVFCEWMGLDASDISQLREELAVMAEMKPFTLEFKPKTEIVKSPVSTSSNTTKTPTVKSASTSSASSRSGMTRVARTRTTKKTVSIADQIARQSSDFGKLLHSAMLDRDTLARPTGLSQRRQETPLKYLGMWGTRQVNINTAPRHVLEALFTFGGDAKDVATEIIEQRRIEPFKNLDDLREGLFSYSESLEACEKYITFSSRVFTIHVKAISGTAEASSTIAITKDGKKVTRIAVLNG